MAIPVVTTVTELTAQIESGHPPVLLDVPWALGDPNGRQHYLDGHIPGAVFVDLETELADQPSPRRGRHPLPDVESLQSSARTWGISDGDSVVVYDATGNLAAARAWWLLRWGGLADVRLLDGGFRAWTASGNPYATGPGQPVEPGDVTLTDGHLPTIDIDETARWPEHGVLLDARAGERYRGEAEPVDPRAGHIPGAVSAPTSENIDEDALFLDRAALGRRFAGLGGSKPVAVYCGSGVSATHQIVALAVAGIDAALFPGSWSQWSNDEGRDVAIGDTP